MLQRPTRGLGWLFFFVADLQSGFGPFLAVYLTSNQWTQAQVGFALGLGSASAMLAQVPAGLFVDKLNSKALAAAIALVGIGASAALLALSPIFLSVLLAQFLHGFASCMLSPALAALTLSLVSGAALAERLGRNSRFAAMGSAAGATLMGVIGSWVSVQAVFWLALLFCIPAIYVVWTIKQRFARDTPPAPPNQFITRKQMLDVILDRRLLAYIACTILFHLTNAAQLPLAGVEITKRVDELASLIIAACILTPQIVLALLSPSVGRAAERWGRRYVLIVGFCALPVRAGLLAIIADPFWTIAVQALDGAGGAVFGVMTPLIIADIANGDRHFSLRMGVVGLAIGSAATISNMVAGIIASNLGTQTAFVALAIVGGCAVATVGICMPETGKPKQS